MVTPIRGTQAEVKRAIGSLLVEVNLENVISIIFQKEGPDLFRADVIIRTRGESM